MRRQTDVDSPQAFSNPRMILKWSWSGEGSALGCTPKETPPPLPPPLFLAGPAGGHDSIELDAVWAVRRAKAIRQYAFRALADFPPKATLPFFTHCEGVVQLVQNAGLSRRRSRVRIPSLPPIFFAT